MTEVIYLPAVSGEHEFFVTDWQKEDADISFWTENSLFEYPYLLNSYGAKKEEDMSQRWSEELNIGKDIYVMSDSGGFQAASKGMELDPEEVILWQLGYNVEYYESPNKCIEKGKINRPADAGIILDLPPTVRESQVERSFEACAEQTKENISREKKIIEKVEKKEGDSVDMDLYEVLQGVDRQQLDQWWNIVFDEYNPNNICVAPRGDYPEMTICYADMKEVNKLHLLATTSFKQQILINYAANKLDFDLVTYDSATYGLNLTFGKTISPYFFSEIRAGRKAEQEDLDMSEFPQICDCPACEYANKHNINIAKTHSLVHLFFALHNIYYKIRAQKFFKWLTKSRETTLSFLRQQNYDRTKKAIEFIDSYVESGFDYAHKKCVKGTDVNQNTLGGVM